MVDGALHYRLQTAIRMDRSEKKTARQLAKAKVKSSKQKKQLKILCRRLNRERSRRREVEKRCADRIHFETLLNEISAGFVNLPVNRIDAAIEAAQRRICECLDLDLSALWQWSGSSPHYMTVTRLHSPPEDPEIPKGIDAGEAFPWVLERLLRD